MKLLTVLFVLLPSVVSWGRDLIVNRMPSESVNTGRIGSDRGIVKYAPPSMEHEIHDLNKYFFSELAEQNAELKKVKYYLLNGETRMAQVYLQKMALTQTKLRPVINRYLAILAFVDGKFERSYKYLSLRELQDLPHYPKICTLKVLNMVILSKKNELANQWAKCQHENQLHLKEWNVLWLDTLVKLKTRPRPGITQDSFKKIRLEAMEHDQLKIFLKLAIYLNQESMIINELKSLTVDQLQDTEVRELVGHVFFRTGSFSNSYKYIEDLNTPNAENMKGNLYVLRQKYEIAYAQFKLALESKQNSQNAMERIIPLAWLLGDWELGEKYAELVLTSPQTQINKLALLAAFNASKGDFEKASRLLGAIEGRSSKSTHLDVAQLQSFVGLMQNKPVVTKRYAFEACDQYDLVNCWTLFQLEQWDSFPLTLRRNEEIEDKRNWEKLTQTVNVTGLKETVYVNQIDIEELDDKLIQLIPNEP